MLLEAFGECDPISNVTIWIAENFNSGWRKAGQSAPINPITVNETKIDCLGIGCLIKIIFATPSENSLCLKQVGLQSIKVWGQPIAYKGGLVNLETPLDAQTLRSD